MKLTWRGATGGSSRASNNSELRVPSNGEQAQLQPREGDGKWQR